MMLKSVLSENNKVYE